MYTPPAIPIAFIVVFVVATQIYAWTRSDAPADKTRPSERDFAVSTALALDALFAAITAFLWI